MKKKLIKLSVAFLLVSGILLFFIIQILGHKTVYVPRASYDKTGFVAKDDFMANTVILENSKYKFTLNKADTAFELYDKVTLKTWYSNPKHDTLLIPADARELFTIFYERKIEASKPFSVNEESIKYGNYSFRVSANTLEVLYEVGGKHNITMTDLPRQIGKEKFDELIIAPLTEKAETNSTIRRQLNFLKAQFNYVENEKKYYLKELTSQDSIDILYNLMYNESDYTQEDYEEDAIKYGFETSKVIPYFEFSVLYELKNDGFNVTLVNNAIVESEVFPIAYIDILPYFGAGNMGDEGYTVIPDGSGVYIDHNNLKYGSTVYEKRIYGQDMSIGTQASVKPDSGEKIGFPMYGYSLNGYGYINTIEKGDAMSTLRAGFLTETSGDVYVHKIPYAHYRYFIRERDAFIFQSTTQSQRVTSWTTDYNKEDFKMSFTFLSKEDATYFDMANAYQTYLVNKFGLSPVLSHAGLHISLLGGYKQKKYFLGYPYESIDDLTDTKGVLKIKDTLVDLGIDDFDMTYVGFSNNGVKPFSYESTVYNQAIASEKALKKLVANLKAEDINLYLEFMSQQAYTKKNLKLGSEVAQNIFHKPIIRFPYDEATGIADKSKTISYILNSNTQNKVVTNVLKTTKKLKTDNVGFSDLGKGLASNLKKGEVMFRNELVLNQVAMLERLEGKNLQLRNPNLYALVFANEILDLSLEGTIHKIVDYDIPFIQLVLNGYFSYAGPSLNTYDSKSTNWHKLKAIETGSSIQYSFTEKPTTYLVKTEYNYLYSTYYAYWMTDLKTIHSEIEGLGIKGKSIINHEVLNAQGSLVRVTYEGGKKILINYETESYVVV